MTDTLTLDAYGVLTEPATLTIERLLPGPIERVWSYLTDGELRSRWLAAGDMELTVGAPFTFVWRNERLSATPSSRPEGADEEHRLDAELTEVDPPHRLAFTWGRSGGVTITLAEEAGRVRLVLVHRRVPDRDTLVSVSAGWHTHLDVLAAVLEGRAAAPFWDTYMPLKAEYGRRFPAWA